MSNPLPDKYEAGLWVGMSAGVFIGVILGTVIEKARNAWREHIVLRGKIRRSRWTIFYTNRTAAAWLLGVLAVVSSVIYSKIK